MNAHSLAIEVGLPSVVSAIVFIGIGLATKTVPAKVKTPKDLLAALKKAT